MKKNTEVLNTFEKLYARFGYVTSYGLIVKIITRYHAPSWSVSKYWTIEGHIDGGGYIDLGTFQHYEVNLIEGEFVK